MGVFTVSVVYTVTEITLNTSVSFLLAAQHRAALWTPLCFLQLSVHLFTFMQQGSLIELFAALSLPCCGAFIKPIHQELPFAQPPFPAAAV